MKIRKEMTQEVVTYETIDGDKDLLLKSVYTEDGVLKKQKKVEKRAVYQRSWSIEETLDYLVRYKGYSVVS